MARNRIQDKTIKLCYTVMGVVCAFMAIFAAISFFISGVAYKIDKAGLVQINTATQLYKNGESLYNKEVKLTNDLVIDDPDFRIGSEEYPFSGVFDGKGHKITLSYGTVDEAVSLFQYITENAIIKNVHFDFGELVIQTGSFGGIVNVNAGTIQNCKVTFSNLKLGERGIFSPLALVNKGTLENIFVEGSVERIADNDAEKNILYGNVCVYNYGTIKGCIAIAEYMNFKTTDAEKIEKGEIKNVGISAIRSLDLDGGKITDAVVLLTEGIATCDKNAKDMQAIEFLSERKQIFNENRIFESGAIGLEFDRYSWRLLEDDLILIIKK